MRNRRLLKVCGPLALVLFAFALHPASAAAASNVIPPHLTDACSVPGINTVCDLSSWVAKFVPNAAGSAGSQAAQDFFGTLDAWVASAAAWVLQNVVLLVRSTTTVNLQTGWFNAQYGQMLVLSAFVLCPVLILVAMKSAFTGEGGPLALAVFLYLPFSIVLTFIAVDIVSLLIKTVDWMSAFAGQSLGNGQPGGPYSIFAHNVATALVNSGTGSKAVAGLITLISALLMVVFGFLIIIEMLFRNAALYVTAVFIPFALAPVVIPGLGGAAKRLGNALAVIIFIKFFIVVSLAVGVAALGAGNQCGGGTCSDFSTVLAGVVILINAAVLPNLLINFLPLIEGAALATILASGSRGVSRVAQPSSAGIYSNIRRDTEGRLALGGGGAGGPRGPAGGPGGPGSPGRFGGAGARARGLVGRVTGGTGGGGTGGLGGAVRSGSHTPRSGFFGRARGWMSGGGGGGGIRAGSSWGFRRSR